jgi:hypothetical protein
MRISALLWISLGAHGSALAQCSPPYLIEWPSNQPVWRFCWTPPNSSWGPDGSGIDLQQVYYRGKLMLWEASMPVLNVRYNQQDGFCGPTYRDWLDQLQPFEADNILQAGYAEPTTTPRTVCDHPGTDAGTFSGVTVERLSDRLILTSQMQAGWYRYIQKWIFHLNGTIEPQFGFTAVSDPCVDAPHMHHGYLRLDFDIEGGDNDRIEQRYSWWLFNWWWPLGTETSRLRTADGSRRWRVLDQTSNRGVEIWPGANDPVGGDAFGGQDLWALQFKYGQFDDGGATVGPNGKAQHIDQYLNGESVRGQDLVVWYRIGHYHGSGLACMMVGPKIVPVGNWWSRPRRE